MEILLGREREENKRGRDTKQDKIWINKSNIIHEKEEGREERQTGRQRKEAAKE